MSRRQTAAQSTPPVDENQAPANGGQPNDEIQTAPDASDETQKQWTARPDPFPIHSVNWQDGYKVSLVESDGKWDDDWQKRQPKLIYIQFGTGQRADQPKNFDAIKKLFKEEYGMYWEPAVQGWAKSLQFGVSPLVKEENKHDRSAVEEAFYKAVALEEETRGPSLSEHLRQRSANAR